MAMNMRRTRPTASTRVAFTLLYVGAALLAISPESHARVPDGAVDSYAINAKDGDATAANSESADDNGAFQKLLESYTADTTSTMQQKSNEFHELQSQIDAKLQSIHRVRGLVKNEMDTLEQNFGKGLRDELYDDMDYIGSKVAELMRRTESVVAKVGEHNQLTLKGGLSEVMPNLAAVGLEQRLNMVLEEEVGRRDRYDASIASMIEKGASSESTSDDTDVAESSEVTENDSESVTDSTNASTTESESSPYTYITLDELDALLSTQNVIQPSETALQNSLSALANQQMQQHVSEDDEMWKLRIGQIPRQYQSQFDALEKEQNERMAKVMKTTAANQCLGIPSAVEMVGKALEEHYHDGTNLMDHASYENGGSVVYELTSSAYSPPPRTNDMLGSDGGSKRAVYEHEKQKMFDEQMESMYHQQRAMLKQGTGSGNSVMDQLSDDVDNINVWEWYTSFKFETLRQFLPDDWERALDYMSDRIDKGSWSDYTPRGAIDALVPDYVYHSLGISNDANFGKAFGRTASPEVAISAGHSKGGGAAGGWTAKPMGHCYPLSMRPEDDPALSILSRHTHMEGGMEVMDEDVDSSLLVGPKYTVRLPYPVHIDAVTLEHRSFPLHQRSLEGGWKGGESAPRWVRVVGFPPCPKDDFEDEEMEDEDECGLRGFDITRPVDLGSVEYQRITVTGREDDYGADDGEEDGNVKSFPGGRRRSIQTFAMKGGRWEPTSLIADDASSAASMEEKDEVYPFEEEDPEPEAELPGPGQCAPPKDEDSLPSCGDDTASTSSSSSSSSKGGSNAERQVVEAVSFIVEENWGNSDFTCLYRVRVHGDAVLD